MSDPPEDDLNSNELDSNIVHKGDLTAEAINSLVNTYVSHNVGLKALSNQFKERYIAAAVQFLNKYVNMEKDKALAELISFYKTWDLYALSVMYLKFMRTLFSGGFVKSKFITAFSELLLRNICPFPYNRLTVAETLSLYADIFFINEKPQDYFTLIENLSYKNFTKS